MHTVTPHKAATHYQTSFRVKDSDGHMRRKLMDSAYEWVAAKEPDSRVKQGLDAFGFNCHWPDLCRTHSMVSTETFKGEEGHAWAMHYEEVDKDVGRRRYWYSDVGVRQDGGVVIASVRISFAWNDEDLLCDREAPTTTVPRVVRLMMDGKRVFSGRPEFRLLPKPINFNEVGTGKALADFIQSPERRYPLVVFNGDFPEHTKAATRLAWELTGKCQVAIVASNEELAEEIRTYLPAEYLVAWGHLRVFFPFERGRPSPLRHRWYNTRAAEYAAEREGMVSGLLRNHSLFEEGAVETIEDIRRLENRAKVLKLEAATPEYRKQLDEFLEEHARVAAERDQHKRAAAFYASEVDDRKRQLCEVTGECETYRDRLQKLGKEGDAKAVAEVFKTLPSSLLEVAVAAKDSFPRLVLTDNALKTAEDFRDCLCVREAWEILWHLQDYMWGLKFNPRDQMDWERTFREKTGYHLAMSEGKQTQDDKKLMRLRRITHCGREYDITPHVKHGNQEPKLVRVYFAFDEAAKKIVVGHIGRHILNYTSKNM